MPTSRRSRRLLAILATTGCAALLTLPGCGRDADENTVNNAMIQLTAMDMGPGNRVSDKVATEVYGQVISDLQGIANGDSALAADASVLVAESQRGLALQVADDAAQLHRAAHLKHGLVRAHLRSWQMHSADAAAAASYNPAPELEELDRDIQARQADGAKAEQVHAEITERIDSLKDEVKARLRDASALRAQAGDLSLQIPRVSPTEGLALTEQVRGLTRQADALELQAEEITVQADRLDLDLHAAQVEIDKFANQVVLLGNSRNAVVERASSEQRAAAASRAAAQQAADEIALAMDTGEGALTPLMDGDVTSVSEQAARDLATAASTARRATSQRRSNAQMAVGQANLNVGDVHWTHAMGLDAYAHLLEELVGAEPSLPASAEYAQRANAARAASTESKRAAFDAYQSAKSALEGTGARGESAELLDQVGAKLSVILQTVGDGVIDAEALEEIRRDAEEAQANQDDQQSDEGFVAQASDDPAADLRAQIRSVLERVVAYDTSVIDSFIVPAGPADEQFLGMFAPVIASSMRLDQATESAFGERFSEWQANDPASQQQAAAMGGGLGAMGSMSADDLLSMDLESLDIRAQGDEAMLLTGDPDIPELSFRREGGQWRMVFEMAVLDPTGQMSQGMEIMGPALQAATGAMDQAIGRVESGELLSNQAVGAFITTQVAQQMMQRMQQGG